MSDDLLLLETVLADADAGRPVALCAIVQTKGSTPQPPGATMLVRGDMSTVGTLGGGCVEAEVCKRAFELLRAGKSGLLDFLLDHDYGWDDGLICGGRIFVGVMPVADARAAAPFREALERARRREPADFPVIVEHEGAPVEYRVHIEIPPTLLVAGAGHVGQALARLTPALNFHTVVIDDRADMASRERFPEPVELRVESIAAALRRWPLDAGTYVVIVTRGHQHDHEALDAVIRRPAAYIGLIGSKRKARMILRDLEQAGVPAEQLARVHTPIGIPIGAITVPEIAVSIAAELVQVRRQTTPQAVVVSTRAVDL